ncbi:riboflavin synthase, alpha subunit [Oceanithermus profundus DSM 14977]|uniref:Riboflavin synthase n=1 Tax=Oceanithermus profundus (strain DSM 14977 / NBRC 100410 / VKM B-2274 / 506) TaxID=670487 RepID=E4U4V4_OCEP5|nr:riboflavin synthase [Oceanithermus profundus]ADR37171.1 riboflavin synthase, alpha subunit [Oceanithermus profundus DSM 14977]
MFTGIVEEVGRVTQAEPKGGNLRVWIEAEKVLEGTEVGDSIATSGACLTVVELSPRGFAVELAQETVKRTAPRWRPGARVNLERAARVGDRLDGHLVTGHVDGVGRVTRFDRRPGAHDLYVEAPAELARYIAAKGSITIDGVSLTVVEVRGQVFSVTLIPHTLQVTTLGELKPGDAVNLEIDIIARYVERLLEVRT